MSNVIEIILRYLRNTHPMRLLMHLVWIFCLLSMLSVSYIVTFHFTPVLELWQRSHSIKMFGQELSTTIAVDQSVNQELQKLLESAQAHRSYLFRYHNGIPSVNGVPFIFHTNTHEVIRPGATRVINQNQRLPTGINSNSNFEFSRRKCVIIYDIDRNVDGANYWHYQTRGAISMIRCAVYTNQGDMLGFVGIDFLERIPIGIVRSKEDEVQRAATAVAVILDRPITR